MTSLSIKNSLLILLLVFLLGSCSISFHGNLTKVEKREFRIDDIKPYFEGDFQKVLYKAKIKLYDKYFSGLFFIKSIDKNTKRIVFVTELGIKIFEFEFYKHEFRVNYCVEMFNKKSIIQTLKKDLNLLLLKNFISDEVKIFKDKEDNFKVLRFKNKNLRNYYFIGKESGHLNKIENMSCIFSKVDIEFRDYKEDFPNNIDIIHKGIKLNIQLRLIENQNVN